MSLIVRSITATARRITQSSFHTNHLAAISSSSFPHVRLFRSCSPSFNSFSSSSPLPLFTQPSPSGVGTLTAVSAADLKRIPDSLKSFDVIVDVREKSEVEAGMIEGAIHIPLGTIVDNPQQQQLKGKRVLVYCRGGVRSAKAIAALKQAGIDNCVNLAEGYSGWVAA